MSTVNIIRAWKDAEYRNSLTEEQRSQLPENPAGTVALSDKDMETFSGGLAAAKRRTKTKTKSGLIGSSSCHCICDTFTS